MVYDVYMPDYYPKFQCAGGDCRRTCCRGWEVPLSKSDYQRLRNLRSEKSLREKLHSMTRRLKEGAYPGMEIYAHISHNEEGACPCLDPRGLCGLQAAVGHEVLPEVCKIFPRITRFYGDVGLCKMACTSGCEVVVRYLLEQSDGLGFLHEQTKVRPNKAVIGRDLLEKKQGLMEYRWPIQCALIDLLQNRSYSVEERMLLLGLALRDLDALIQNADRAEMQTWLRKVTFMGQGDDCRTLFEGLVGDTKRNAASHINLLRAQGGKLLAELVESIFRRYGVEEQGDVMFFQEELVCQAKEEFHASCPQGQILLENLMVNYLFQSAMPFEQEGAWKGFQSLAAIFGLLHFVMYSVYQDGDDPDLLVDPVTALCRSLMHSKGIRDYLVAVQSNCDSDSLAHMAMIILG